MDQILKSFAFTMCFRILSVTSSLSTKFQLPLRLLPAAEQKIEVLSEHLHCTCSDWKRKEYPQNTGDNFLKNQNLSNGSSETRSSESEQPSPLVQEAFAAVKPCVLLIPSKHTSLPLLFEKWLFPEVQNQIQIPLR